MNAFLNIIGEQKLIGELETIEELEQKIAPDGGETVLPLVRENKRVSEW